MIFWWWFLRLTGSLVNWTSKVIAKHCHFYIIACKINRCNKLLCLSIRISARVLVRSRATASLLKNIARVYRNVCRSNGRPLRYLSETLANAWVRVVSNLLLECTFQQYIYIYILYIYNSYTYDIYNIHIYIYTHIIHPPMVSNFSAQVCFWWLRGSNFRLLEDSGMYPSPIMNHGNHWRRDYVPLVAMELLLLNPAKSAPVEIVITQKKGHG